MKCNSYNSSTNLAIPNEQNSAGSFSPLSAMKPCGKSICMSVEVGFDTDCNGATVGSVLGMANGIGSIPAYWQEPIKNTIHTSIFGINTVKITDCVKMTMEHIADAQP